MLGAAVSVATGRRLRRKASRREKNSRVQAPPPQPHPWSAPAARGDLSCTPPPPHPPLLQGPPAALCGGSGAEIRGATGGGGGGGEGVRARGAPGGTGTPVGRPAARRRRPGPATAARGAPRRGRRGRGSMSPATRRGTARARPGI